MSAFHQLNPLWPSTVRCSPFWLNVTTFHQLNPLWPMFGLHSQREHVSSVKSPMTYVRSSPLWLNVTTFRQLNPLWPMFGLHHSDSTSPRFASLISAPMTFYVRSSLSTWARFISLIPMTFYCSVFTTLNVSTFHQFDPYDLLLFGLHHSQLEHVSSVWSGD